MSRRNCAQGFTLIEALVAMALISIAASALLASMSGSARNSARSMETLDLATTAETRLAALAADPAAQPARTEMTDDMGRHWVEGVRLVDESAISRDQRLYEINIELADVNAPHGRRMRFVTYAIGSF